MTAPPLIILSIVLAAIYFLMVIYCLAGWLRLQKSSFQVSKSGTAGLPTVTIVMPARNEAPYIKDCLEAVLKQNYPKELLEVIMIDDYSLDETLEIARGFLPNPNLTVI